MKANINQSLMKANFTYSSGFSYHQWSKAVADPVLTLSAAVYSISFPTALPTTEQAWDSSLRLNKDKLWAHVSCGEYNSKLQNIN